VKINVSAVGLQDRASAGEQIMKVLIQPLYDLYRKALRHSQWRWVMVLASLVYLVSPIDFSTDIVPVIGWLDDGVIITILLSELSQVVLEQRQARKAKAEKPESSGTLETLATEVTAAPL
jgi:uncharacterized membrane protein YkvA (DUF1232 family)